MIIGVPREKQEIEHRVARGLVDTLHETDRTVTVLDGDGRSIVSRVPDVA